MVYRKTEERLSLEAARKKAVIFTAVNLIARRGIDATGMDEIAERVGIAVGVLYKDFASRDEIIAAATANVLEGDLGAMRAAVADETGVPAFALALAAFYGRQRKPRLVRAMFEQPVYKGGIRDELARLLKGIIGRPGERTITADAVLGAMYGIFQASGSVECAVTFGLRCAGIPPEKTRKVLAAIAGEDR
jgi:AcrR family transcriptional regulator